MVYTLRINDEEVGSYNENQYSCVVVRLIRDFSGLNVNCETLKKISEWWWLMRMGENAPEGNISYGEFFNIKFEKKE